MNSMIYFETRTEKIIIGISNEDERRELTSDGYSYNGNGTTIDGSATDYELWIKQVH